MSEETIDSNLELKGIVYDILLELDNVNLSNHSAMASAIRAGIELADRACQILKSDTPAPLTYTPAQVIEMVTKVHEECVKKRRSTVELGPSLQQLFTTLGLNQ